MITRTHFLIGLAAGVGGASSNLVDLAQLWTGREPWLPSVIYYIGLAIFFGLGATLALIFGETDHKKAFFLGVSLPALIAAAQTQVDKRIPSDPIPTEKAAENTSFFQIIPAARAQQPETFYDEPAWQMSTEAPLSLKTKMLALTPRKECPNCEVWLYDKNGQYLQKQPLPDTQGTHLFSVPDATAQFGVWNGQINPQLWSFPTNSESTLSYQFDYNSSIWNNLRRGLGDYNVKPYNLEVLPQVQ